MRQNEKGFGITIVLIIILAVTVLVAGSLYLKKHTDKAEKRAADTSSATKPGKSESAAGYSQEQVAVAAAKMVKFSALPTGVQTVVKAKVTEVAPVCIKDGQLVDYNGMPEDPDAAYAEIGSLIIGIGCDSPAASLFAKDRKEGTWSFIASTQFAFDCDLIFENLVPKQLMEIGTPNGECYDRASDTTQSYDKALGQRFL